MRVRVRGVDESEVGERLGKRGKSKIGLEGNRIVLLEDGVSCQSGLPVSILKKIMTESCPAEGPVHMIK